tara:strand:- start:5549 stop:7213 length:1665 start_codon:yes stop_codon:yes gene_type:complete
MINLYKTIAKYKWLLLTWLIINTIQAYYTNLHYDEAYYWLYSKTLNWGYFDHPPMIALISKIGDIISHSTLGIRIIPIIMGVCVLGGIFHLIGDNKSYIKVFIYVISFPLITSHIAGFLALPDITLCFFFILYLFCYKRYLKSENVKNSFLLSLTIAGMIYSKYHALLIILLTIIANIKLVKKKSFWTITIISIFLMIPHIIWQFKKNFPSILYHISDRSSGFNINNFLEYIYSQIILAGPFSGIIILFLAITFIPKNTFEKTLKYIALGFYIFFLFYCFKSRIEAHWTSVSTIALIIISYKQLSNSMKAKKILPYLLNPALILILIARIVLAGDHLEEKIKFKSNFMNMYNWANELDSISDGYPILFANKYHDQAVYSFAKNKWVPGAPNYYTRFSQIDLNKLDTIYNGQKVFALSYGREKEWISKNNVQNRGSFINDYYSYTGIILEDIYIKNYHDSLLLCFKIINKTNRELLYFKDSKQKLKLHYSINGKNYRENFHELTKEKSINKLSEKEFKVIISKPKKIKKEVEIDVGLSSNSLRVFRNRKKTYTIK